MKRALAILLFVPFVMALAPPCHAEGSGEIAVSLVDVPAELRERSVLITLGNGPNDTDAVLVTLNGLNQYSQTVTLPEGTYYCNAAVQYDALNDWPLREVDGTTFLQVEAGGQYELQYEFAGESWFTEVTSQTRYYTPLPLRQPPADYLPEAAQISAYLTAPAGFSQHCIVYLQNLYSGTVYALDVYESNQLAAVCMEADSGLYAFLSARVVGDAAQRYQFECEKIELNTDDGASFHLTVTDIKSPAAELCTPAVTRTPLYSARRPIMHRLPLRCLRHRHRSRLLLNLSSRAKSQQIRSGMCWTFCPSFLSEPGCSGFARRTAAAARRGNQSVSDG